MPDPMDPPPDVETIRVAIVETLRQAANMPTVMVRDDWLLGVVAVQQIHLYLYELFVEDNKPMPPSGPKQWSHKLDARQRALLEGLPVPQPLRDSVLAARDAALSAFLAEAPPIASRHGVAWPGELEAAVLAFLARHGLGLRREC